MKILNNFLGLEKTKKINLKIIIILFLKYIIIPKFK